MTQESIRSLEINWNLLFIYSTVLLLPHYSVSTVQEYNTLAGTVQIAYLRRRRSHSPEKRFEQMKKILN